MPRRYNTLGRRILSVLETGPRKRTVLIGIAGDEKLLDVTLKRLRDNGLVQMVGTKRGARYALAKP